MAKSLKRFDEESQKWVTISSNDSVIRHYLEDGSTITDKNIKITNTTYRKDENTDLDDALDEISNDINTLKGNVSWLAEHGGGSQGTIIIISGSTAETSYGIEVIKPTTEYISTSSLTVSFKITGGTNSDKFQYKYTFDSNDVNPYVTVKGETQVDIFIDNIKSITENTTHTFRIDAKSPLGNTIPSVTLTLYENTLSLSLDTENNTMSQGGSEVLISKDNYVGGIYFNITNGVLNSEVSFMYECNGVSGSQTYTNTTSKAVSRVFSLWTLLKLSDVSADEIYTISVKAQSTLGTSIISTTDTFSFNVRITDPNSISIFYDGLPYYDEETESSIDVENDDRLNFSVKISKPKSVTNKNVYYAIKLKNGDFEEFISGDSFLDSDYYKQVNGTSNTAINVHIPLSKYSVSNGWQVITKAWTYNGVYSTERIGCFNIIESNNNIYPRQFNERFNGISTTKDTCLFEWSNDSVMKNNVWYTYTKNVYKPYNSIEDLNVEANIYVENTSNGISTEEGIQSIRLQNDAYAYADMSEYSGEITNMFNEAYSDGFDVSITFKSDDDVNYKKNIFFWGENSDEGELLYGIKINLTTVEWQIFSETGGTFLLTANICPGKKNTVDFSYDGTTNAYIFVNGIINSATNVGKLNAEKKFPNTAYFGCDYYNGIQNLFSDVNIYEFCVYTKYLNPLQIVVNSKNARLEGERTDETVISEYKTWKKNNLIYESESNPNVALSYLFNSEGEFYFDSDKIEELKSVTPIPIVEINANGTQLTEDFFTTDYSTRIEYAKSLKADCEISYYDPSVSRSVEPFRADVSLQGTSTLGYHIKNLEVKINETCTLDSTKYKLFQPKKEWMPENEFTLKADVVDSAHANNATIGKWINDNATTFGIMEENPAIVAVNKDALKPVERMIVDGSTKTFYHTDTRTGKSENTINFDENVTVKYNLEGFPVILLIKFAGSSQEKLIGIYSFNLGRYSYYNMGLSFLKAFSRRSFDNPEIEVTCPAIVDYYEEYDRNESIDGISLNNIYCYEFNAEADRNEDKGMAWSQAGLDWLQWFGDFNFNGVDASGSVDKSASIWNKLIELFKVTAQMGLVNSNFSPKYIYKIVNNKPDWDNTYGQYTNDRTDKMSSFDNYLSVKNAVGYFIVATAFGMVDSLGKNLTLRTWDGGNKWYTCFYDMDTALGISNEGIESIPVTAFIDTFSNKEENNNTTLEQTFNTIYGSYNTYNSKLWEIFRDTSFLYENGRTIPYYNALWANLRISGSPLDTQNRFVSLMEEQIASCGELLYDYDYNTKYIEDSQNISMLHGNRIEYVRNWLRKRLYFLDGVFYYANMGISGYVDSPFNLDTFNMTCLGNLNTSKGYNEYTICTVSPTFAMIKMGANGGESTESETRVFLPEYTDTIIKGSQNTSSKQIGFTSSSLYTKLDGFTALRTVSINTNNSLTTDVLPSLTDINLSNLTSLANDPVNTEIFIDKDTSISNLESINMSGCKFSDTTGTNTLLLNFYDFTKLKTINVSNSCVTSLVLPKNSILSTLNIRNSDINNFSMSDQIALKNVDFTGCNKLQSISINNSAIENINISGNTVLSSIEISNCSYLTSVTINSISSLKTISLNNNDNIKSIYLSGCTNTGLTIEIVGGSLETVYINGYNGTKISLPNVEDCSGVNSITVLNSDRFKGFLFNDYTPTYTNDDGEVVTVLDLTPFKSIDFKNIELDSKGIRYIRVSNVKENPNYIYSKFYESIPNVERVFGCIGIDDDVKFNLLSKFYINHDTVRYSKIVDEITFVDDNEYTNIVLSDEITSLNKCFFGTSVDYSDMYYIFSLKNMDKVNCISNIFSGCKNIEIAEIDANIFKNCTNVNDITGSFSGCNIACSLPNGLLDPITNKSNVITVRYKVKGIDTYVIKEDYTGKTEDILEEYKGIYDFSNVFTSSSVTISDEGNFFNDTDIETISNFNPQGFDENGDSYYEFHSDTLLNGLPKLKYLTNSFNKCGIDFTNQELFSDTPEIVAISKCFSGITVTETYQKISTSEKPIFGNCNKLETISNSFIFTTGNTPYMEIDDTFFSSCNSTLISITNNNSTSYDTDTNVTSKGCFINAKKYYLSDKGFPYNVFKGCAKLKEMPGFLNGLVCLSEEPNTDDGDSPTTDTSVILPNNILEDCVSLENFSYGLSNLSGITYTLSPDGFANCKNITNIDGLFSQEELSESLSYTSGFKGSVPYHMFYNPNNTITSMERCFSGCRNTTIKPYTATDDVINTYGIENGEWNEYIYDGASDFFDRFTSTTIYTEHTDMQDSVPDKFKEYYGIDPVEPSEDIIGLPEISESTMTNWLSTVFNKTNYFCPPDIFKYCQSDASINGAFSSASIINERSNKMGGFRGRIPNILIKPLSDIDTISDIFSNFEVIIPEKWGSLAESLTEDEKKGIMYPVDLFSGHTLYTVSNMFGGSYIWGNTYVSKSLLDEIASSVSNISGFWNNVTFIVADEEKKDDVYQIPENMFDDCTNLTNISNIFSDTNIHISPNYFSTCYKLTNVSSFMSNADEAYGEVPNLWSTELHPSIVSYRRAFYNIDPNIKNYDAIPDNWIDSDD